MSWSVFCLFFFVRMYVVMYVKRPLNRGPFSYLYTSVNRPYLYTTVGRFHLGPRFVRFSVVTLCFFLSTYTVVYKYGRNKEFLILAHICIHPCVPFRSLFFFVRMYVLMCVKGPSFGVQMPFRTTKMGQIHLSSEIPGLEKGPRSSLAH